jgi:predicted nucleic acid-binding protein
VKRVFADTFFFFAYLSSRDRAHRKAVEYFDTVDAELITTEAVLTELADGLTTPPHRKLFVEFYDELRSSSDVRIISTDGPLFRAALELYRSRLDKEWSLTDCISFVVMQREDLKEALTGDHHFEQAGLIVLLPS